MSAVKIASSLDLAADLILYQGDCLDLLPRLPDSFVKLVVTSPPYNLGKSYESRLDLDEYLAQQRKVITECVRVLHNRGSICWQVGNYVDNGEIIPLDIVLYPIFASFGLHLRNRIVWHFGHGLHASKRFSGRYEVILWFFKVTSTPSTWMPCACHRNILKRNISKGLKRASLAAIPWARTRVTCGKFPTSRPITLKRRSTLASFRLSSSSAWFLLLQIKEIGSWILS